MAIKRKKGDCSECGAEDVYLGRVKPAECIKCYKFKKAQKYAEKKREKEKREREAIKAGKKKKAKKIKQISDKQKKRLEEYEKARDEYMAAHEVCEVRGCYNLANDLHHKAGRVGSLLSDKKYFMAVCRGCHENIHEHPKEAEREGYIVRVRDILK